MWIFWNHTRGTFPQTRRPPKNATTTNIKQPNKNQSEVGAEETIDFYDHIQLLLFRVYVYMYDTYMINIYLCM